MSQYLCTLEHCCQQQHCNRVAGQEERGKAAVFSLLTLLSFSPEAEDSSLPKPLSPLPEVSGAFAAQRFNIN